MPVNSKILDTCSCPVLSTKIPKFFGKPHLYIAFVQNYVSTYRFHYQYEHVEQSVSNYFLTKFVVSIIDILNSFRKQALFYDQFVQKPIRNYYQLSEAIQLCGVILGKLNQPRVRIEKIVILELLDFLKQIFDRWESYVFQNAIFAFV